MPASIGVNLRVTGHCRQGGRKYMEDFFSVAYQQTEDERDLEYAFFGIYDGHGGAEAAAFAKEHLMETIIKHKSFWSDCDEDVLRAIKDGYIATHYAMWKEQEKWPRTPSGLPSTAGTTASIAFIRKGKIYIGHVGDSGIILGYQEDAISDWRAQPLTRDHKPENSDEMSRINQCGGKVVSKSGVPRVVWNRPKMGHKGPVRRSTPIDEIPFLAVARSLGDLWSYNSQINQFIVSPDPDCSVVTIDPSVHRCLVFGTDGLFNMLSPNSAVHIVQQAEKHNEQAALSDAIHKTWLNPSKLLVEKALERWHNTKMRADNTSVVTLMLDPPGPPRAQVLKNRKKSSYPDSGLQIMTRYENSRQEHNYANFTDEPRQSEIDDSNRVESAPIENNCIENIPVSTTAIPLKERNSMAKPRDPNNLESRLSDNVDKENLDESENSSQTTINEDASIQINEISSSSLDTCDDNAIDGGNVHNLRSTKKKIVENAAPSRQTRKSCECVLTAPTRPSIITRKSSRLDFMNKKASSSATIDKNKNVKFSQKVMKCKTMTLKKKQIIKKTNIKPKKVVAIMDVVASKKSGCVAKLRSGQSIRRTRLSCMANDGASSSEEPNLRSTRVSSSKSDKKCINSKNQVLSSRVSSSSLTAPMRRLQMLQKSVLQRTLRRKLRKS